MSRFKKLRKLPWPLRLLILGGLWLLRLTVRVQVVDPRDEARRQPERPHLYPIWHNRLLLIPLLIPRRRRRTVSFLASRSRDGGYIADLLDSLGMQAIRGSSSKGGAAALRQMEEAIRAGRCLALTPDGPRGPRYAVQDGLLWVAARTGAPIVPVTLNAPRHWELRGWDRTQIPKPFSRVELVFGEPIAIPAELTPEALARWREAVRDAMLAICQHDHEA